MLPLMVDGAALLRSARANAGLSRRALATKAGVPTSTVSRVEDGQSDPTITMLVRLLDAAGHDLVVQSQPREDRLTLAELANAYSEGPGRLKIDWTRLRAFVDRVEQHPERLLSAIADPPAPTLPLLNALLAALAEQLADEHGIERPPWTRAYGPLEDPWFPPSTPQMRQSYQRSSPEPFRRRNIVIPRSAIFRSAA
jgi:transcriptional regulator with XRE-family HTH domain